MDIAKFAPNILTTSRLIVAPVTFFLILSYRDDLGSSWYLFVLAILAGASDLFDGRLARHHKVTTRWGTFFDPLTDKVLVLGAGICFSIVDRYWILPVIFLFVREVSIGILRLYHYSKGYSVPASKLAKAKTSFQGFALTCAAFPVLKEVTHLHTVLIWLAVAITTITGVQYILAIPNIKKD